MNALEKYLVGKEKTAKKERGHFSPGTAAMAGALFGPIGAGVGAELGRRGRETEGSPALRAYLGSILGAPAGLATGVAGGALVGVLAKNPKLIKRLKVALAERAAKKGGLLAKLRAGKAKRNLRKGGRPLMNSLERAILGGALGGGLGTVGGYFEGARRGAESVKYK